MASNRQLVLVPPDGDSENSLGVKAQFVDDVARFNIATDGSSENAGIAFGPGFRLELPLVGDKDPVSQALITITEEDNAWPVLTRICREMNWRLMDLDTGRTFGV